MISSLFGKAGYNKIPKKRESSPSPPQLQPNLKSIRLVPVSIAQNNKEMSQPPPVLEKMEDFDANDQPPTLSPVVRKSQRTKTLFKDSPPVLVKDSPPVLIKDLPPVLEPSNSTASTSTKSLNEKDQIIQRLKNSLSEKTTELNLLRKKLKITEELLQFYQKNHWKNEEDFDGSDELIEKRDVSSIFY